MAVPKKKVSRSRRNMRRYSAAYKLDKLTYTTCPTCGETVRPHTICSVTTDCYQAKVGASRRASAQSTSLTK